MKWIGTLAVVAAMCCACGGSGSSSGKAAPVVTVTATPTVGSSSTPTAPPTASSLTLTPIIEIKLGSVAFPRYKADGSKCQGAGAYSYLRPGRVVTIYNQRGTDVVGTGFIKRGFVNNNACYMGAAVRGVPPLPFYKVQFVNGRKIAFSEHDLLHHTSLTIIG